jgi:hypothetical protein
VADRRPSRRIERRLNLPDGVDATVNYATGRAYFTAMGGQEAAELVSVLRRFMGLILAWSG